MYQLFPLCHGFLKMSPIIKYGTSDTYLPVTYFFLKQRTLSSQVEHVSSGGSWSSAYQALVNVSLSQRPGDKVSRWAAWKGSETRVFGGVFKRRGLVLAPPRGWDLDHS